MRTFAALVGLVVAGGCSPATLKVDGGDDTDALTLDGGGGDAGPGEVTVLVLDDAAAAPQQGVNVAFFDRDGTLVTMLATGADGRARASVYPDAMIAVGRVIPGAGSVLYRVEMVAGVQPGDLIEMGPGVAEGSGNSLGMANIRVPNAYDPLNGHDAGACYLNSITPMTIQPFDFNDDDCTLGDTTYDLLATSSDSTDRVLAYATIPGVTAGSGGTHDAGAWQTDLTRMTFSVDNAAFDSYSDPRARVIHDGLWYEYRGLAPQNNPVYLLAGESGSFEIAFPPTFTQRVNLEIQVESIDNTVLQKWATNLAPTGAGNVDLTADLLPTVDQTQFDVTDPARWGFEFTINGDASSADAQLHGAILNDVATDETYFVILVAPADQASPFRMPAVPADLIMRPSPAEGAWPPPQSALFARFSGLLAISTVADYAELRASRPAGSLFADMLVPRLAQVGTTVQYSLGGQFPSN